MSPMLSTFGGGSIRGFAPGGSGGGSGFDDVFPNFSGYGAAGPISSLSAGPRVSHGLTGVSIGKVVMEPGGNRLWLAQYTGTSVWEFDLSTSYDLSTLSSNTATATYAALDTVFAVDPTGEFVMAGDRNNTTIYQLSTPWNLMGSKTAVKTGLQSGGTRTHWGSFGDQGEYFALYSDGSDYLRSYRNTTLYDYSTAQVYSNKSGWQADGSGAINAYGGQFSADGKALMVIKFSDNGFHFWEMGSGGSQPWDVNAIQNISSYGTSSFFSQNGCMGCQLVRAGGGTNTTGHFYGTDNYNSGYLRQLNFTWLV